MEPACQRAAQQATAEALSLLWECMLLRSSPLLSSTTAPAAGSLDGGYSTPSAHEAQKEMPRCAFLAFHSVTDMRGVGSTYLGLEAHRRRILVEGPKVGSDMQRLHDLTQHQGAPIPSLSFTGRDGRGRVLALALKQHTSSIG